MKNELVDGVLVVNQLASDELPTVWIKETPPLPCPAGKRKPEGSCERSEKYRAREERTIFIIHGNDESGSTLQWQLIQRVVSCICCDIVRGVRYLHNYRLSIEK